MGHTWFAGTTGLRTRLGWVSMAGEVVDDKPHVPSPLRTMDDWILSVVLGGSGLYRHADGTTVPFPAGSIILIPPGQPHWYGTRGTQAWSELFIVFNGPIFDLLENQGVLSGADGGVGVGPRTPARPPSVETLRGVVRATVRTPAAAEHQLVALADWLLDATRPDDAEPASALTDAARRLAGDTAASVDMHELAATSGLSYDTFRRRFAAEFGQPPTTYRNNARLAAAANLLKLTDLTTREIARRLGYTDEFHFSRRFRGRYGVPPTTYRRG